MSDFESSSGPVRVKVKGLSRAIRSLERAGADASDMRELMHRLGMLVVKAASAPVLTGRLEGTIRAGRGKTKAVVRAGGARAPYAPIIEYGDPARGIEGQSFIRDALQAERGDIFRELDNGIEDILRKNDLL